LVTAHGRVVKNVDGTVTYTPAATFSDIDTFSYVIQDTGGCISGQPLCTPAALGILNPPVPPVVNPPVPALAIVTVEQATAQASFRPKVQKWDISGTSSIINLQAVDAVGTPVVLFTKLVGAQEVPPLVSAGSGDVNVSLRTDAILGQVIDYTLSYTGLTDVQQAHIHNGPLGTNGGVNVFLCTGPTSAPAGVPLPPLCPVGSGTVTGTLTTANLTPAAVAAGVTLPSLITAIQAGNTYANVHTTANAGGEIRGQIGRNVVAVHDGPTTTAPLLGVLPILPLTLGADISSWSLPTKLNGVPSADRTITIQTSAGSTVTVPLKVK
jgi:hypothetical protein